MTSVGEQGILFLLCISRFHSMILFFKKGFVLEMATGGQQVHANMLQIARERQIRTTTRYHLTPVEMAIIKNITNNSENVERREPLYNVAGTVNWYRHCGKQYRGFSKYLKINLPYDPAIPLLRNYLKNMKTLTCQDKATDRPVKHRSHCQRL